MTRPVFDPYNLRYSFLVDGRYSPETSFWMIFWIRSWIRIEKFSWNRDKVSNFSYSFVFPFCFAPITLCFSGAPILMFLESGKFFAHFSWLIFTFRKVFHFVRNHNSLFFIKNSPTAWFRWYIIFISIEKIASNFSCLWYTFFFEICCLRSHNSLSFIENSLSISIERNTLFDPSFVHDVRCRYACIISTLLSFSKWHPLNPFCSFFNRLN